MDLIGLSKISAGEDLDRRPLRRRNRHIQMGKVIIQETVKDPFLSVPYT